ncbi:hypothetical protein WG66_013255 [Moniliophthora roreri]|uniref:Uncharacterized protein n=1 Tax=Moniliophthora roreri TaxID=221103 RepID=A0A0W0EXC4_MONRR|nr:hypothetical protein WG66_013255 [Moniliophthora roreri]
MSILQAELDYPRRVMVDDTDRRIRYEGGSWSLDKGSFDHRGVFGAPYNGTMHGTNQNGSSFSLTFEGQFIQVRGAKDTRNIPVADRNNEFALPDWSCKVDGHFIDAYYYFNTTEDTTNDVLCQEGNLAPGAHTFTLVVAINNPQTQMFWFDSIEYAPDPEVNLANETMRIYSHDPSIKYHNDSGAWIVGNYDSFVYAEREGTEVSLYTFIEGEEGHWQAAAANYIIDNSTSPTDFYISGSRPAPDGTSPTNYFNELLFTTPKLSPGPHTINLTLTDGRSPQNLTQGLTIDYFFVTVSDNSSQLNAIPESNSSFSTSRHKPVGAIVGGVIGGILGAALLGLGAFFLFKWWRKRNTRGKYHEIIPFDTESTTSYNPARFSVDSKRSRFERETSASASPSAASPSAASPSAAPAEPTVVERHHEDSGVRYPPQSVVVDVPPNYTES